MKRKGATAAAQEALDRIRGNGNEFVLHLDVDVIADFQATNYPGSGGLSIEEVREALLVFVQQKHLAAIEVTAYNPAKDSDGRAAKLIIDLLAEVLGARLDKLNVAAVVPVPEISGASAGARRILKSPIPRTTSLNDQNLPANQMNRLPKRIPVP